VSLFDALQDSSRDSWDPGQRGPATLPPRGRPPAPPPEGTPRLGAPRYRKSGFWRGGPRIPKKGDFGPFSGPWARNRVSPGSGVPEESRETPGGYRGAPPRGVDVKPPLGAGSRGSPGAPDRGSGPPGSRRPGPEASGALPEPLEGPPGPPGARVLHQPLAPGPRGSRGGVRRALPGPPGSGDPLPGSGLTPAPYRGGGTHRRGWGRGGRRLR